MLRHDQVDRKLTRRAIVAGATAGAVALAANPAFAQRCPLSPRTKGPLVWMDMDQQELDDAYTQAVYAPFNPVAEGARGAQANQIARSKIAAPQIVAYGSPVIEQVLIYRTSRPTAPTLVF